MDFGCLTGMDNSCFAMDNFLGGGWAWSSTYMFVQCW